MAQQQLTAAQAKTDVELSAGIRYLSEPERCGVHRRRQRPVRAGQKRAKPLGRAASARLAQAPLETEQRRRELITLLIKPAYAEIERRQLALRGDS